MNSKKQEGKKHEIQTSRPRKTALPFEHFDLMPESGLFKEMDRFFNDYLPHRWGRHFHFGWPTISSTMEPFGGKTPRVDIIDRETDFLIKAELPGVEKKDISISLVDNTLTLEATMSEEKTQEKKAYYRQEICSGEYRRTIDLPAAVKENEVKATFKNGILEVSLPKTEQTKRTAISVE